MDENMNQTNEIEVLDLSVTMQILVKHIKVG